MQRKENKAPFHRRRPLHIQGHAGAALAPRGRQTGLALHGNRETSGKRLRVSSSS